MTDLFKQLEDKKKELIILNERCSQDKNNTEGILRAEIAILEQAIAEIKKEETEKLRYKELYNVFVKNEIEGYEKKLQKQRQEILDEVEGLFKNIKEHILNQDEENHNWNKETVAGKVYNAWSIFKKRLLISTNESQISNQLNQPKTEQ